MNPAAAVKATESIISSDNSVEAVILVMAVLIAVLLSATLFMLKYWMGQNDRRLNTLDKSVRRIHLRIEEEAERSEERYVSKEACCAWRSGYEARLNHSKQAEARP